MTKTEKTNQDVVALLKARYTLLWAVSQEEGRVESALIEASASAGYEVSLWDCEQGECSATGEVLNGSMANPVMFLKRIREAKERKVYVLRDLHKFLDNTQVLRALRNTARALQNCDDANEAKTVVVLTPSREIPMELENHVAIIEYPLPERKEIASILDDCISAQTEEFQNRIRKNLQNGNREAAIDAAIGLTAEEVGNSFTKSLVTSKKIDAALITTEKKRIIAKQSGLKWIDPDPRGLAAVGGLENLKEWLTIRQKALSQSAREYGLPVPRGVVLTGVPGCGKSLVAKSVATAWGLPLLLLDLGAQKSKWVGESEANLRKSLATAEAIAPCVLWIDEFEKGMAGANSGGGDGGVSADASGAFLNWMQEKAAPVFVIITMNDATQVPAEQLRKGRFDDMFFVDLPTSNEREAVVKAALAQYGKGNVKVDAQAIARKTEGFSGAEIAALIPDAMFTAFADNARELTTEDIVEALKEVVPLSKTASERIKAIRDWAKGKARLASKPEVETSTRKGRAVEL